MTSYNTYAVNAEIAHRHRQIRNDYSPRRSAARRPGRRLSLPKLPALAGLPKVRFHRPAVTA